MYSDEIDYQLTDYRTPRRLVETAKGDMRWSTWLNLELRRILADGRRKAEIRKDGDADKKIALFVNRFKWRRLCPCQDCQRFDPVDERLPMMSETGVEV
jgi:hypothetical protein